MYYDVSHVITNATAANPNSQDATAYDEERIHDALQRIAPKLYVSNDGIDNLYVLVSHGGEQTFSPEQVIYPGDIKTYLDVYSLRLRSPTANLPYRVSEYDIHVTCCPVASLVTTPVQIVSISKAVIHNVALPGANTDLLGADLVPTSTPCGFIIQLAMSIVGSFYARVTNGGNTQSVYFNQNVALTANSLYIFEMLVHAGDTVNFRYSTTGGTILVFRVQEADSAVI